VTEPVAFFLPCSGQSKQSPKRVRQEPATSSGTRGETISQGRASSSRAGRVKREKNPGRTAVSFGRPATRRQEQNSEVRGSGEGSLRADQDADQGRERRTREGEPIGCRGRPLEGANTRRATATVSGLTLANRRTALPEGETPAADRVVCQSSVTACRGRRWAHCSGNVRRGAGVERRTEFR